MPDKILGDLPAALGAASPQDLSAERPAASQDPLRIAARSFKSAWVEQKLLAEITYLTWTADGLLRHTVYVGLRQDKPAEEVRREAGAVR